MGAQWGKEKEVPRLLSGFKGRVVRLKISEEVKGHFVAHASVLATALAGTDERERK